MLPELKAIFPFPRQSITFSKIIFFSSAIIEWNNLDLNHRNSISFFKKKILSFKEPSPNSAFDICNPKGIKLISLSHLREHKFKT